MTFYPIAQTRSVLVDQNTVEKTLSAIEKSRNSTFVHTLAIALDLLGQKKMSTSQMSPACQLIKKYGGAGLFQIAEVLIGKAHEMGLEVHCAAESLPGSSVGILPQAIGNARLPAIKVLDDIRRHEVPNYCDLLVHYHTDPEKDFGVLWKLGNAKASYKPEPWAELGKALGKTAKIGIKDLAQSQKEWLSYAWQLNICGWTANSPKFSFNVISGELEFKSNGADKTLPSLSIDKVILSGDLAVMREHELGTYFIDGKQQHMTHGEALFRVCNHIKELFKQPESFIEELKALIKQRHTYIDAVMQPVFGRLARIWPQYNACQTLQEKAHMVVGTYLSSSPAELHLADEQYLKAMKTLVTKADNIAPDLQDITKIYQNVIEKTAKQSGVPPDLL